MTSEKRRQTTGLETVDRAGGDKWSSVVRKLLPRAPQFSALAEVAQEQGRELSRSQREFLDHFAGRLTEGVAEDGDASSAADVDRRGKVKSRDLKS